MGKRKLQGGGGTNQGRQGGGGPVAKKVRVAPGGGSSPRKPPAAGGKPRGGGGARGRGGRGGRGGGRPGRGGRDPKRSARDEEAEVEDLVEDEAAGGVDEESEEEEMDFGLQPRGARANGKARKDEDDDADGLDEEEEDDEEGDGPLPEDELQLDDDDDEDDVTLHKQQLEELKEKDPEFYRYLQENDQRLLQFGEEEDEEEDEDEAADGDQDEEAGAFEDEDSEQDGEPKKSRSKEDEKPQGKLLTAEELKKWQASALEGSLWGLKRLAVALRSACRANEEPKKKKRPTKEEIAKGEADYDDLAVKRVEMEPLALGGVQIDSPQVLNSLLFFCIRQVPGILDTYLGYKGYVPPTDEDKSGSGLPKSSKKWRPIEKIVTSFTGSFLKLLAQITEPKPLAYLLRHLLAFVPYVASFPRYPIHYLRALLQIWSRGEETDRIMAFLNIHRLAIATPFPFVHRCMKEAYLTYVRNAKFGTGMQRGAVNFMANGIVELFVLDGVGAYQLAFVYIRQLAVHLRQALTQKSAEAHKTVYNWQFVNCLRVWARLLALKGGKGQDLEQLLYPFIHLVLGVIRLQPTPRFYPLRFICLRFLVELAEATGVFIPVAPYLLEVLEWPGFTKGPKPGAPKPRPVVFQTILKAGPTTMASTTFINGVVEEVATLLGQWLRIHSHSVAFPELTLTVTLSVKKFIQKHRRSSCPSPAVLKRLSVVLQKVEENKQWIEKLRGLLAVGPKELAQSSTTLGAGKKSPFDLWTPPAPTSIKESEAMAEEDEEESPKKATKGRHQKKTEQQNVAEEQESEDGFDDEDEDDDEEDEYAIDGDDDLVTELVDPSAF